MSLDGIHKNLWRAGLFLHHLHDEQRYPHLRFEEFAAYLSAFLACARYVTDSFERAKDKGDPERTKW